VARRRDTFVFTVYEQSDVAITTVFPSTVFNAAVYVRAVCADRATSSAVRPCCRPATR